MISYKSLVFRLSSLVFVISSTAFAQAPRVVPDIVDSVPHEMTHFTQGLFFDVVVREREGEGLEVQVFFAEAVAECLADSFYRLGVLREDAHDNLDLGRCPEFSHIL